MQNNPHKQQATQSRFEKILENILDKTSDDKTYLEKNLWLRTFLIVISVPVIAYSLFTGGSFIYSYIYNSFQNATVAVVSAFVIVITVEALYYYSLYFAVEDLFDGDWQRGGQYTNTFILKSTLAILAVFCSVFWSIKGAPDVADFWTRQRAPLVLETGAHINNVYDAKIAIENSNIKIAKTITWANKCTTPCKELIDKSNANKDKYEAQREKALAQLQAKNDKLTTDYNKGIIKRGKWYQGFAGGSQVIGLLIIFYMHVFNYAVKAENSSHSNLSTDGSGQQTQNLTQSSLSVNTSIPTTARTPIGFKLPPTQDKVSTTSGQVVQGQVENNITSCQDKTYEVKDKLDISSKSTSTRQDEGLLKGKVIQLGHNLVFEHEKEDGQKVHYTKNDVINNKNRYANRVDESKKRLATAQKNNNARMISIHKRALKNRLEKLAYWITAETMFEV